MKMRPLHVSVLTLLALMAIFTSCKPRGAASDHPTSRWRPVTFTNAELRAKGTLTGDGCQWVRALAIDATEGNFMLWCTDVGGLFRSLDAGKTWEPANIGFHSRGSAGVAIDPHNPRRALVVAANSVPHIRNGLYLTTDQAASWTQVLPVKMSATRDQRRQIAYDPSSYDAEAGLTRVIYWSTLSKDPAHNPAWGETMEQPAFYKSTDGGETWTELPGGAALADAQLAIHPTTGDVYAATPSGLKVSRDGGTTWTTALEGKPTGVTTSVASPDSVWVTLPDGLHRSDDRGATFTKITGADSLVEKDSPLRGITVAPSDPSRLVLWRKAPDWKWDRFYSHDGGETWNKSAILKDRVIVPTNAREGLFAIHPKNPDIILAPGGDYPMLSHDGGATYTLAGNGVNNIFIGGGFNFSAVNPDVIFLASQDYATLLTSDGGQNWKYLEPGAKGWGGYNYGGYASTAETLVVGEAEGWRTPKLLSISRDGGTTWNITKDTLNIYVSYGDPKNPDILFAGHHRSKNGGNSWSKMKDVSVVFTHDFKSGALYGVKSEKDQPRRAVLRSTNGGTTWTEVFNHEGGIDDLAIDFSRDRIYFVSNAKLFQWEKGAVTEVTGFIPDQDGPPHIRSVAIDPQDPSVVYIAGNRNRFASNASAQRSTDGGLTWTNLTLNTPLDGSQKDGGREAHWVRVNAKTREAWFATNCYGVWRHAPPP
jgi:photosystem II stability/assembly factor-like uncharacterized protein